MNWFSRLSLLSFVVFSTQVIFIIGQTTTPWENTQLAERFIASFLTAISRSNAFSYSQMDDMSVIGKTLTAAMEKLNSSNTNSKTKFQALNMLFASAMAEVTTAESGGISIEKKINAIENALNFACLETIGVINMEFVSDIKNLIYTFAHTTANGVSTASVIKVEDNTQVSTGQQGPSTSAKIFGINRPDPQRSKGIGQGTSALVSSVTPNLTGSYGPPLQSVTRLQASSLQTPSEQQAKGSTVILNMKSDLQGPSGTEPLGTSSQVLAVKNQRGPGGYGAGLAIAAANGGSQSSSISGVNGPGEKDPDNYIQIRKESSKQGKYRTISQGPRSDGPVVSSTAASSSDGVGSATIGESELSKKEGKSPSTQEPFKSRGQGPTISATTASAGYGVSSVTTETQKPTGLRRNVPGTEETIKTRNQRLNGYGMTAAVSATVGEIKSGIDAKEPLVQGSSGSREQEDAQGVAVVQIPEGYESGNYGWGQAASASEAASGIRPVKSTNGPQGIQGSIGKNAERSSGSSSRAVAAAATGSYISSTGTGRYQLKGKEDQVSSKTGSQNEKRMRKQEPSGEKPDYQGQYGTSGYTTKASAAAKAEAYENGSSNSARVSRVQSPSGQGLGTRRPPEAGSLSISYGSNEYERVKAAEAATVASGYKSSGGVKRLNVQGLSSNEPVSEVRNSHTSGIATAIAAAASGYTAVRPTTASGISADDNVSEDLSFVSSVISSSPRKPSSLSNTVSSTVSQVVTAQPCLSDCDVFVQTLLDIILALVHLLGSCNICQFDSDASTQYTSMPGQSEAKAIS